VLVFTLNPICECAGQQTIIICSFIYLFTERFVHHLECGVVDDQYGVRRRCRWETGDLEFIVLSCWHHQPSWLRLLARPISRTVFFLHIYPLSQTHLSRCHSVLGGRYLSPLFPSALLHIYNVTETKLVLLSAKQTWWKVLGISQI